MAHLLVAMILASQELKGCLVLTDQFPCNRATRAEDEKTRERVEFKEFEGSALFECTSELTTPVGVTEGRELVEF